MAVLFGNFLRSRGTPFSVYGLCWPYAQRYSLSVARTPEELLRGKDLLVWGGGGLLVPWNPAVYGLLFPRVAAEFSALVGAARAGDVRICALSVGGAVGSPSGLTPRYKEDLITNAEYVSVRNPQDLPMLEGRGIRGNRDEAEGWNGDSRSTHPLAHTVLVARRVHCVGRVAVETQ